MSRTHPLLVLVLLLALAVALSAALAPVTAVLAAEEEGGHAATASATPSTWPFSKFMWASITPVFSVMGTSWAQSRIGVAGAGAMAEKPELAGTIIILIAIPETMVILGFVVAAMIILMG